MVVQLRNTLKFPKAYPSRTADSQPRLTVLCERRDSCQAEVYQRIANSLPVRFADAASLLGDGLEGTWTSLPANGSEQKSARLVMRITASDANYEENLRCKIVLRQIRPHFTAARFSLFADCDKRPSDPLSPQLLEGGLQ